MARPSVQELTDLALSKVPPTGEIQYSELYEAVRAENPDALQMLPELKKRGVLKARLEFVDGEIRHYYSRVGG